MVFTNVSVNSPFSDQIRGPLDQITLESFQLNHMSNYQQGKNWTASGGQFYNGRGEAINNPQPYFNTVASNAHGYNASYSNGHGAPISNPTPYYTAVANDAYGYNGVSSGGAKK